MRMVGTECIRNILFILPQGTEWMEWRSVHSGIRMRNKRTRAFYIPELWINKRALSLAGAVTTQKASADRKFR